MKLNNKTIVLNQTKVKSSGTIRGSQSKIFALLICSFLIAFTSCDNPLGNEKEKEIETVVIEDKWDPVMVIVIKTTDNQIGTLSFVPANTEDTPHGLVDGTYTYRLHVEGELLSKGTVTVSGAAFNFISDSEKTFTGKIEDRIFSFDSVVASDSEEADTLTFQTATVPSTDELVIPAQSIVLKYNNTAIASPISLNIGEAVTLTTTILPESADTQVWWTTDKLAVVKIVPNETGATITAQKGGTATIRVKTVNGGKSAECSVTIIKPVIPGFFLEVGENLSEIDISGQSGTSQLAKAVSYLNSASATSGDSYRLVLDTAETTSTGYTLSKNITLTLVALSEEAGRITKSGNSALFTIAGTSPNKPHLILDKNITLQGHDANNKPLVLLGSGTNGANIGELTMNDHSRITGNTNTSSTQGGGVRVYPSSIFTMNGGRIDHNKSTNKNGQGGGVRNQGTFTMNGGSIDNNLVGDGTNAGTPSGGGVHSASGGTFTMTDGSIYSNTATGTKDTGSSDYGGSGGGVCAATFEMKGGKIENNTAERGGGIYLVAAEASTVTIDDGSIIRGNHATVDGRGSAVELLKGTFIKKLGSIIYGINETETFVIGEETFNVSNCKTDTTNSGYSIFIRNGDVAAAVKYYYNGTAATTLELNTNEATSWSTPE
jgi:hypothetical protein